MQGENSCCLKVKKDRIQSGEYIGELSETKNGFSVNFVHKKHLAERYQ